MLDFIDKFIERRRMEREGQLGTRKRRTESVFGAAMDRSTGFILGLVIILWAVCVTVLTIPGTREYPQLVKDQRAPETIYARTDFVYEDKAQTALLREEAVAKLPQATFSIADDRTTDIHQNNIKLLFDAMEKRSKSMAAGEKQPDVQNMIDGRVAALSPVAFKYLYDKQQYRQKSFLNELKIALDDGIISDDLADRLEPDTLVEVLNSSGFRRITTSGKLNTGKQVASKLTQVLTHETALSDPDKAAVLDLMLAILTGNGNLDLNEEANHAIREQTANRISPVMLKVSKNDIIVRRNEKVTEKMLDALAAENETLKNRQQDSNFVQNLLYNAFWSLILVLFAGFYLMHIHPAITRSSRSIALIVTVSAISLGINYFAMEMFYFFSSILEIPPQLLPDAIPLALTAVLLTVMIGYRVALYVGLFVAMVSAIMIKGSFNVALEGFVLSALCGLMVRPSGNYRSFFLRTFLCVSATVWLLDFDWFWHLTAAPGMIFYSLLLALGNALFTAVAAMLLIFLFELIFNVSTNMSLMVLCDYNHPLLKELHLKAPGTSLHSQNVAVLAENAAIAIGANAILARAGALFHDIGKIQNPEYFIENNQSSNNPHDRLSPRMSSLIITTHVKDGLDMALQYKICRKVRRFIQQHHGTDLIQYFYHMAMTTQENVSESDYRYPGPLPHDKEVVIVSLADACEAACRSLEKPTASKIEGMVNDIFRKRWRDGQLDEADLTVEELSLINESFVYTLTTMYHSRIAYPKDENNDEDNILVPEQTPSGTEQKTPAPGNE